MKGSPPDAPADPPVDPEAALVIRLGRGDESVLDELYARLGGGVFAAAFDLLKSREEAEEVVQDTFLTLCRKAHLYNTPERSPRAFIYTVARNKALSRLRRRKARPAKASGWDVHEPSVPFAAPQGEDQATRLYAEDLLAKLSDEERRLLEGAFYQGHTHAELAELTGLPLGTLKSKLRRALLKLKDYARAETKPS